MAVETQQVVQNSSETVAPNQATGSKASVAAGGMVPASVPVVAPKGFRTRLQQMLLGWQQVIPSDSTVTSSGGSLTEAAVLEQLQGYLEAYLDLDTHVTATKQARAQVRSQLIEARKYFSMLKSAVTNLFGAHSPQLAQFGLVPGKARKPLSSAQLAVRAAKAKATRGLRSTKGVQQKAPLRSGPMAFVEPVQSPAHGSAPAGTPAASTAPVEPTVSAVSPPTVGK